MKNGIFISTHIDKMKNELKTLKDIEDYRQNLAKIGGRKEIRRFAEHSHLKQEAIKEIKSIYECVGKYPFGTLHEHLEFLDEDYSLYDSEEYIKGIINYIKWKNNITEEDLK